MIGLTKRGIRWDASDMHLMARVIGSEHAVVSPKQKYRYAPPLPSILKLAKKKGGLLSPRADALLHKAEQQRKAVRPWKELEDFDLDEPGAQKLFKHQRADLGMLYEFEPKGVLLASEAGVGKTLLGIRYPEHLGLERIMLITPNAAKEQWRDEVRRWSHHRKVPITIVHGSIRQQIKQIKQTKRGWCIGHWESLVHARKGWLDQPWDMAILDEVQYMANRNAQRTDTACAIDARYRMAISAHPYANGVNELFPILQFLYPKLYPGFWRWAGLHIQIDAGVFGGFDLRTPRREELLKWEIAPFTIRRLWKDVWKNLPPITRVHRMAYLTPRGEREYAEIRRKFFARLEGRKGKQNILAIPSMLARVTRMRQYLIDPGLLGGKEASVKYPIVYDLIKELGDTPPVIFTMWRETAIRLKKFLEEKKLRIGLVVGGMGSKRINRVKRKFLAEHFDAVIIMITVGGTALNFGKFGKIIYLDHPWNMRDVEQTEGRVRRPEEGTGKLVPCTSYHIMVSGSYEEKTMYKHRINKHMNFAKVFTVAQARELFDG